METLKDLKETLKYWIKIRNSTPVHTAEFRNALVQCQKYEALIREDLKHKTVMIKYHKSNIGNYEMAIKAFNYQGGKRYMFGGLVGDKPSLLHRLYLLIKNIWEGGKI